MKLFLRHSGHFDGFIIFRALSSNHGVVVSSYAQGQSLPKQSLKKFTQAEL